MTLPAPAAAPCLAPDHALAALRDATRTHHERIDRQLDLPRMEDAGHYGRVLQVFDAFLAPWEAAVAAALPASLRAWLHRRSRRGFLGADLRALALPPLAGRPAMPRLADAAAAWGSLYVLEGSALGGQLITRAVAAHGLTPAHGAAYFHGWGPATGAMWRDFRAQLDAQVRQPQDVAAACAGAQATFDALSLAFDLHLHERPALA